MAPTVIQTTVMIRHNLNDENLKYVINPNSLLSIVVAGEKLVQSIFRSSVVSFGITATSCFPNFTMLSFA